MLEIMWFTSSSSSFRASPEAGPNMSIFACDVTYIRVTNLAPSPPLPAGAALAADSPDFTQKSPKTRPHNFLGTEQLGGQLGSEQSPASPCGAHNFSSDGIATKRALVGQTHITTRDTSPEITIRTGQIARSVSKRNPMGFPSDFCPFQLVSEVVRGLLRGGVRGVNCERRPRPQQWLETPYTKHRAAPRNKLALGGKKIRNIQTRHTSPIRVTWTRPGPFEFV